MLIRVTIHSRVIMMVLVDKSIEFLPSRTWIWDYNSYIMKVVVYEIYVDLPLA